MTILPLLFAGLALGSPASASATGVCDQINGIYSGARIGATHAMLVVKARLAGSGGAFSDAGSVTVTSYDGGSRLWVEGNTPPHSMKGWLLRVPPDP